MNRINRKFAELRKTGKKAFVAYITCGDPSLTISENLICRFNQEGVDILELGVPFSDPLADGATIQRASQRALKSKTSLRDVIVLVKKLRKKGVQIPLVLFSYYNPIHRYGSADKFCRDLAASGLDGIIIPDLPPEEGKYLESNLQQHGLDMAYLLAPTSTPERIKMISRQSRGFIYYVSRTGVTGAQKDLSRDIRSKLSQIRQITAKPLVVGFGLSSSRQIKFIAEMDVDGVVVGSAIIEIIEKNLGRKDLVEKVSSFVRILVRATKATG